MAVLFITEFSNRGIDLNGAATHVQSMPEKASQVVAIGAASAQSAAMNAKTSMVRICADVPCSVKFGTNPIATATAMLLPANTIEYLAIPTGQNYKIAVITNT